MRWLLATLVVLGLVGVMTRAPKSLVGLITLIGAIGAALTLSEIERGLAGAFNTNIVRAARRKADELTAQGKTVRFYIAGKKGRVLRRFYPKDIAADVELERLTAGPDQDGGAR